MSGLQAQLRADLNAARKAQDKPLTLLLGTVLADVENHHIALKRDLVEGDIVDVLRRALIGFPGARVCDAARRA